MPPMTAPVDGPGVIVRFSSEREREREREREGDVFIGNSFKCHATASGTLMLLTCNICVFFLFCCRGLCEREQLVCESAVFHY